MNWHPSTLSVVLVCTAVIAVAVAVAAWRRRAAPGATILALLMLAVAEWTLVRGLETAAVGFEHKLVWARPRYIGAASVAPLWFMFALAYVRQVTLRGRALLLLWTIPAVTVPLTMTSSSHQLIWTTITPSPADPALLVYAHGPWYWVVVAFSYVLMAAGTGVIAIAAARFPAVFRGQACALLLSGLAPWIANVSYVMGWVPVPGLDVTPVALTISGVVLAWVIFQRDLLDLIPVAREALVEHLTDGVIVLDARGRIVDVNGAATRVLGLVPSSCVGAPAAGVLAMWPDLVAALTSPDVRTGEIRVHLGGTLHLDFRVSPLRDVRRRVSGWLVSLRDATDRRRAEEALRQSEAHFRALFEESPDACYLIGLDGRFVDANRAAESLIGQRRTALLGRTFVEAGLLDAADAARAAGRIARAAADQPTGVEEFAVRRPDGTSVNVEVSSSRVRLGGQVLVVGVARDVTERRRAERALRESEERYRTLVESIEELICVHDLDGRIVNVNRAGITKMGYERAEDLVGRRLVDFLAPQVRAEFAAYIAAVVRDGGASGLMRVTTRDGDVRELEFNTRLGRDMDGTPVVWGVSRDVTERRRIEREIRALNEQLEQRVQARTEELRRSRARFEALAGAAPVGIFRTGYWGDLKYANEAWSRITGATLAESRDAGYLELIHPDDRARFLSPWPRSADDDRVFEFEGRLRRRDGSIAWVMVRTVPETSEPGRSSFVGTMTDITALRVAEDERRKLAALVDNSPELVGIADMKGRMLYMNAAGRGLLGLGRTDDVTALSCLDLGAPEARVLAASEIAAAVRAGRAWDGETTLRRLDTGDDIDVGLRAFPIRDVDGVRPAYVAMVAQDIRERRRAEAALHDRDNQLRHAQKMEAVGRLAGGVAHDFNNLLTIIAGQSELLLRDLAAGDPRWRPTEAIRHAADRAAALTRQLLTFGRKQVLQPAVLDLNDVVQAIGGLLRRVIGEDVELTLLPSPSPAMLTGDRSQLEQVVMNLVVNARDAMPQGGRLAVEIGHATPDAAARQQTPDAACGPYVTLAVTDTGSGMSPEVQARIFEPFFTTKEPGKGTGLGLATVYGIVHQHGGVVTVESVVGAGTTMRVALPALRDAAASASGASEGTLVEGHETVLVVEDEDEVRAIVRLYLETLGYTVIEASGPDDALDAAERYGDRVELLLTDVVMPRMSGRELADELHARRPSLPVLFMSGYSHDAFAKYGVDAGEAALIEKPFTLEQLSAAVRRVLDAR